MFNLTTRLLRLVSEAKGIEEIEEKMVRLVSEPGRWMLEAVFACLDRRLSKQRGKGLRMGGKGEECAHPPRGGEDGEKVLPGRGWRHALSSGRGHGREWGRYGRDPFMDYTDVKRNSRRSHERIEPGSYSGSCEFKLTVLSKYIFIGSGSLGISGGNPYYAFYRNLGRIAIPGSSIKGAVRCLLEAVSYSCPGVIHSASALRDRGIYQCSSRENRKGDLCAACGIFGTVGYGGRASFRDAFPIGEAVVRLIKIGDLFPPRIERDRKFYVHKDFNAEDTQPESQTRFIEAVSGDTAFLCRMDFENLTRAELSLLFHTMGIGRDHYLKLGGAKPRCLGTVTFEPRELMLRSRKDLFKEGRSVEENTMQTCSRIMDDVSLLNKQALERYKREFCHQGEACPRRLY